MADILNIGGKPSFDDRIIKFEFHTYNPYVNTTFGHSNEIRYPYNSRIYTCYRVKAFSTSKIDFKGKKCIETTISLNNMKIDRSRSVKIISLMKDYAMFFNKLLGFCEDYKRVVINVRYELIIMTAHKTSISTLVTIDCSRQNEFVKNDTMDIRLEFEFKENVTANTTAYCLILHA
ncbi:hypothetical protein ALC53_11684 [Atta colombica]|uniref:Double jelly roll-like domain-containing protein n=1 Tax=Atta colombica TaxID=520822 RepID=A0A195B0E2_9HYME|nr:hypothetical protein ALC53_11684 [Atta colombica]